MSQHAHQQRLEKILDRLETRARQCPGMFPITSRAHWLSLAQLQLNNPDHSVESVWKTLEAFDRDPAQAHRALNQLLAQQSPLSLMSVDTDPKATARKRLAAIESLLAPQTADYNIKHG